MCHLSGFNFILLNSILKTLVHKWLHKSRVVIYYVLVMQTSRYLMKSGIVEYLAVDNIDVKHFLCSTHRVRINLGKVHIV